MTDFNTNGLISIDPDTQLTEEGVKELLMKIEHDNIISRYSFPEKPDGRGYYRVYVKDPTVPSGRKQLRDKNLDNLKEKVYQYEKGIPDSEHGITFKNAFEYAIKFEQDNVSPERKYSRNNTICKYRNEYNRFFGDTAFEDKFISDISLRDIDMQIRAILKRFHLSKKGMESIRSVINLTFNRAAYMGWIDHNPASKILWKDYKKLLIEATPIKERAYSEKELNAISEYLKDYHAKKIKYIPAYALEFQMIVGMRRGEIAPLLWEDIDFENGTIFVHQELISLKGNKTEEEYICNYTKNGKSRYYPIAELELEFLQRLKDVHDRYYPDSKFLFPADTKNGCITNNMTYQFFRRMCNNLGIPINRECIRGTHALRRNAITEMVNKSNGNCILVAQMFGNSPETIRKHYYVGDDIERMRDILNTRKSVV